MNDVRESDRDRRQSIRFPIEREVHYRTLDKRREMFTGTGKTLNISSSGLLFTTEHTFAVGTRMEVSISWPAALSIRNQALLIAEGRVAYARRFQLALRIERHRFVHGELDWGSL